jgi:DNA recombination protein RmuC
MSAAAYTLIGLVLGAAFGFLLGLLRGRARAPAPDDRLANELRQQLGQREAQLAQEREQTGAALRDKAAAEARAQAADASLAKLQALHEQAMREARENLAQALADQRAAFRSLSVDALREVQPQFTQHIVQAVAKLQEEAKGDLAQRRQEIATLVEPLKQHLQTYQERLQAAETAQAATLGEVRKQLETLSQSSQVLAQETQSFRMVLRSNQARGRWGEETLRRVVESAGLSQHCDFTEQTQAGDAKPDLVVRLPGERVIIVDAKVPDLDFLSALEAADAATRGQRLEAHARKLRETIKALAERDYPAQFPNALDYVILFLPAESLFSAALEGDRDLIVWAASRHILLATPASLIALLRAVSLTWQQHQQTEESRQIAEAATELYDRVAKFAEHLGRLREGLDRANAAFDAAAASFQARVRPAGQRLERLAGLGGGAQAREIPELPLLGPGSGE